MEIAQSAIILAKMLTVVVISIAASAVTKVFRMRKPTLVICFSMTREKICFSENKKQNARKLDKLQKKRRSRKKRKQPSSLKPIKLKKQRIAKRRQALLWKRYRLS